MKFKTICVLTFLVSLIVILPACSSQNMVNQERQVFCGALQDLVRDLSMGELSMGAFFDRHLELRQYMSTSFSDSEREEWNEVFTFYLNWPKRYPGPPSNLGTFAYMHFSDNACGTDFRNGNPF
jgi:hypothetical protein